MEKPTKWRLLAGKMVSCACTKAWVQRHLAASRFMYLIMFQNTTDRNLQLMVVFQNTTENSKKPLNIRKTNKYELPYRGRPNVRYSTRKHPLTPNPFSRISTTTTGPAPATSKKEEQLQETWGKYLDSKAAQRLLEPIMEDLVHSAIAETIPELLVEARQEVQAEMEQAAMTEASAAMQQLVEQGQLDPTEAEMQLQSKVTEETAEPITSEVKEPQSAVAVEATPREEDMESTPSDFT